MLCHLLLASYWRSYSRSALVPSDSVVSDNRRAHDSVFVLSVASTPVLHKPWGTHGRRTMLNSVHLENVQFFNNFRSRDISALDDQGSGPSMFLIPGWYWGTSREFCNSHTSPAFPEYFYPLRHSFPNVKFITLIAFCLWKHTTNLLQQTNTGATMFNPS